MKSKLKLAKEMFNAKLEEAKSEATKPHDQPARKKTKIHIKKPPRSMGVIGIGAALLVFYLGLNDMKLIWECSDWPTVSGIIISSDIRQSTEWERKGIKTGRDRTLYLPNILYNYEVQGKKYRSYSVFFEGAVDYLGRANAREIVSRYPPGKNVSVHYNPENPQIAVLETGIKYTHLLFPATGILFILLGLWALFGKSEK
ncbi:MAG: DUF3592 domain-containing protein [Desulfobacteraceae bacterium]|nr:DUF3592 domain-containing protein [Desulfobacteraceae bacterium]